MMFYALLTRATSDGMGFLILKLTSYGEVDLGLTICDQLLRAIDLTSLASVKF